jgi:hypothetical protein
VGPRRVRFKAEWVEELAADPEPGDRVAVPFRELVVREVAPSWEEAQAALAESQERGVPLRFAHLGHAREEDLDGADALVGLAPTLVEPGVAWRASAHVKGFGRGDAREHSAATLSEALDVFPVWAGEWLAHVRDLEATNVTTAATLSGAAELAAVEPGGPARGRTVLRVFFGTGDAPSNPEGVLRALEALCEEAERLYGAADARPARERSGG